MSKIEVNTVAPQCGTTLTLGESGDTVTLGSGASQSGFGRTGTVDWQTTKKTTDFTAVNGEGYFVDTGSGVVTVTLPASPSAGNIVYIKDYDGNFGTNKCTIARNGSNIRGATNNFDLEKDNSGVVCIYVDATEGWQLFIDGSDKDAQVSFISATGGTETNSPCGNYKIHSFTGPGTFTVSQIGCGPTGDKVDYLVIGGGGSGAIATCTVETTQKGVISYTVTEQGRGYTTTPVITVAGPGSGTTATASAVIDISNTVLSSVRVTDPGIGYTVAPTVTVADPNIIIGRGNFLYNDIVTGQTSLTQARVKSWDIDTKVLKVTNVGIGSTVSGFIAGEEIRGEQIVFNTSTTKSATIGIKTTILGINTTGVVVGAAVSGIDNIVGAGLTILSIGAGSVTIGRATMNTGITTVNVAFGTTQLTSYNIRQYDNRDIYDDYSNNDEFELEADEIIDFAETNPFGTY